MNDVLTQIAANVYAVRDKMDFLDLVFGIYRQDALNTRPVVLFGAGQLGKEFHHTLKLKGVSPSCFCDNDDSRTGGLFCGIPVISFNELQAKHKESLIVVVTKKYLSAITKQLLDNGFREDLIRCKDADLEGDLEFVHLYAMNGTQSLLEVMRQQHEPRGLLDVLIEKEQSVLDAYDLLADQKSKDLFIAKLSLLASNEHFDLYKKFIISFSEPVLEFGVGNPFETEEYYYFNNDVLSLSQNEIYVDVGAADGDTILTFTQACKKFNIEYKHIYAFEPDLKNYQALVANAKQYKNVSCHQLGLWSHSETLRFISSGSISNHESAKISSSGDAEICVVSLDEFLKGAEVTFIKMDPPGNVIPEAVKGATDTIARYKPVLALGAYHSLEAIFEIPLLVHDICPDYKLFLRHNSLHSNETDLYAFV